MKWEIYKKMTQDEREEYKFKFGKPGEPDKIMQWTSAIVVYFMWSTIIMTGCLVFSVFLSATLLGSYNLDPLTKENITKLLPAWLEVQSNMLNFALGSYIGALFSMILGKLIVYITEQSWIKKKGLKERVI